MSLFERIQFGVYGFLPSWPIISVHALFQSFRYVIIFIDYIRCYSICEYIINTCFIPVPHCTILYIINRDLIFVRYRCFF
ncbi:hypothetical protein Hdeb2414_s0008g00276191 [Helianthus debilis subsp. tardiflorus]